MIEKLTKIYDIALENPIIPTKILTDNNISNYNISQLIKDNIITKVKHGFYEFIDYAKFYELALNCLNEENYIQAKKYFLACFNHDYEKTNSSYYLMGLYLSEDLEASWQYFTYYYENTPNTYNSNFYLLLFNYFYQLPDNYLLCAKHLKLKDILIPENSEEENINNRNINRQKIFNNKFYLEHEDYNFENKIINDFINHITKYQNNTQNTILELIKNNDYTALETYLNELINHNRVNVSARYCYKLVKALINIKNAQKIPSIPMIDPLDIKTSLDAIDINNYKLALKKHQEWLQFNSYKKGIDYIYLLLVIINQEIEIIEKNNNIQSNNYLLINLSKELTHKEFKKALNTLNLYLNNIKKPEYEFLILDLIKISILKEDFSFRKVLNTLNAIKDETYSFDLASYIFNFYNCLTLKKYNICRIYLDIINRCDIFGSKCVLNSSLNKILLMSENVLEHEENMTKLNALNQKLAKTEPKIETPEEPSSPNPSINQSKKILNDSGIVKYYHKIPNLNGIVASLISGTDINTITTGFKVSRELVLIACLLIAREYFYMGNTTLGESYLSIVRKAKNKTKLVYDCIYEVDSSKNVDLSYNSPITHLLKK